MRKKVIAITAGVLAGLLALGVVGVWAAGQQKATTGILGDEVITHAASHFVSTDGVTAGAEITSQGNVEGLGKVEVTVSASWDWGLYSTGHRCALMNTNLVTLDHDFVPSFVPWDAEATITITTKKGDQIFGEVVGGSVCELAWIDASGDRHEPGTIPGDDVVGTDNEGLTSYEITGGTGKFEDAFGSALTRSVADSSPGGLGFIISEIFLHLND